MIYKDIKTTSTRHDKVIHLYRNKCVLNAKASFLFCSPANYRVGFRTAVIGTNEPKTLVFIGIEKDEGYHVTRRKGRHESYICSVSLCKILCNVLGCYGSYRISDIPESFPDGKLYYQILPEKLLR